MVFNGTDIAGLIYEQQKHRVGINSARIQDLSAANIDSVGDLLKKGSSRARWRVGGFYGGEGTMDTLLLTEDVMVLGPILIEEFVVIEEIGIDVTTAGTEGNLYTALYADRGDGYPGDVVHESAALTVTAAFKSTTGLTLPLPPGLYWGGALCNQVTTTVVTVRSLINNSRFVGETAGANDVACAGYSEAALTATPPASFTSTPTVVGEVPRLMLKVKSH